MNSSTSSAQITMEDCYYALRERFKNLEASPKEEKSTAAWMMEHTALIENSVGKLYEYNKPVAFMTFIKNLSQEFKINLKIFNQAEKSLIQNIEEKKREEREEKSQSGESKTVIVEKWINDNYDLFYNVISYRYIGRRKGDPELKEVKLENLYHDLDINHLKYGWSDLKILLRTDFVAPINPFLNYFENLPLWDGTDYIQKLAFYINVSHHGHTGEEKARFENQFKKMFVRSIACALEHNFNKHCFVLVSEKQHGGKSSFLRWLCPPELQNYYTENIGLTKDDRIALAENFIINIDELDSLAKYDINALKSLFSKDGFKERLPYAERTEFLKRRCNFVASTNRKEFLADETGSVRWICFQIDSINWKYLEEVNINKVWGYAYHLFKSVDFKYQLTVNEIQENEKANRQFFVRTVEMELISKLYLPAEENEINGVEKSNKKLGGVRFMTATEIKEDIIGKSVVRDNFSIVSLGKALKFLGFEQKSLRFGEQSYKGYWIKETEGTEKWHKSGDF